MMKDYGATEYYRDGYKSGLKNGHIAGLREAAEIVVELDAKYIGAQGCFKEAQTAILARIAELEKKP